MQIMKKSIFKILISNLLIILLFSCGYKSNQQTTSVNNQELDLSNATEMKVWHVPNVEEGAESYFSPDGKSLIFNGKFGEDENHFVYTINIDGSNLTKINKKGEDACSYYHPTENKIVWTSTKHCEHNCSGNYSDPQDYPQSAELYMSDLDGNNVKRLTNNEFYDAEVSISPDGTKILFGRQINGEMELWKMNLDGTNQKQITNTPNWQEGGAFYLNDNETIIYRAWKKADEGQRGMPMEIFTIKDDGSELTQITNNKGTNWAPFPAPNGKHFAYVKVLPPHNYEIFIMNLETKKDIRITHSDSFDGFPSISPDGKLLSFSSSRNAAPGERKLSIFLMDISSLNL